MTEMKILSKEQIEQKYGITIDTTPTQGSTNLVTSGGVYQALPDTSSFVTKTGSQSVSNKTITSSTYNGYTLGSQCAKGYTTSVTSGSSDLVTSGAVYTAINSQSSPGGPLTNFYFTFSSVSSTTSYDYVNGTAYFTYNSNYDTSKISSVIGKATFFEFADSQRNGITYYAVGNYDISSLKTVLQNKTSSTTVYVKSASRLSGGYTGRKLCMIIINLNIDGWQYSTQYSMMT